MNSVAGNKERIAVTARSRKYGVSCRRRGAARSGDRRRARAPAPLARRLPAPPAIAPGRGPAQLPRCGAAAPGARGGGRGAGAAAGAERPSETCRRRRASLPDPLLLLPLQVTDPCSPTKPAAPFSPESWYRKAYEESRAGSRPAPEGAGSALGSSGTPSPGSGTSSPGSFTGSPGPASPGIGTSSPGSLGGSPGFGTGSPGSGSGGGSSPGSDRGVWCEHCNARLAELKRQALKLLIPGPVSSKVSRGWGGEGGCLRGGPQPPGSGPPPSCWGSEPAFPWGCRPPGLPSADVTAEGFRVHLGSPPSWSCSLSPSLPPASCGAGRHL